MKMCECGCGQPAPIAKKTIGARNQRKGEPLRFISGHNARVWSGNWRGGRVQHAAGYVMLKMPEHPNATKQGYVFEHVLVAARALRKPLPPGAVVHHVNGIKDDNRPSNLVVCDAATHTIIHTRQAALEACGNAAWRRCLYCKAWDAPDAMYITRGQSYHRPCRNEYLRKTGAHARWEANKRAAQAARRSA